jgi:aspartate aminotransferase
MSNLLLNQDVVGLKESATLKINQLALKMRREGKEVFHLGFGQSPFPVQDKIIEKLKEHSHEKDYLPTLGLKELRDKICSYYNVNFGYDFDPENICVGPGSKEMLFQVLFILEGSVIIPAPSWVSYGPQVNIRGKDITRIVTEESHSYKLQASELEAACKKLKDPQKVLIINSPNNPTGAVYTDEEIKSITDICKKENIIIMSDEIYAQVDFTGVKKKGFYHYYPEGTLVTAGLSKSHSAGGYRMGFIATSEKLKPVIRALASMVSETFSAVSAPIQYSAVTAYSNDPDVQNYIQQCTDVHKVCGEYLAKRFNDLGISTPKPDGAFYIMPNFEKYREQLKAKGVNTSSDLCDLLLSECHVAMLPGSDFYLPDDHLKVRVATVDYDGGEVLKKYQAGEKLDDNFVEAHCPRLKGAMDSLEKFFNSL